jgi:uncharacterized membrane protein
MRQARFKGNRGVYKCQTFGTLQIERDSFNFIRFIANAIIIRIRSVIIRPVIAGIIVILVAIIFVIFSLSGVQMVGAVRPGIIGVVEFVEVDGVAAR